jgi:hypothetical protein
MAVAAHRDGFVLVTQASTHHDHLDTGSQVDEPMVLSRWEGWRVGWDVWGWSPLWWVAQM